VLSAQGGLDVLMRLREEHIDAIVLAARMPILDGRETCRRLRAAGDRSPVLLLTEGDSVDERVAALEAGADDALSRPYAPRELLARVRAATRRSAQRRTNGTAVKTYADLRIDRPGRRAFRGDRPLALTRTEFLLLDVLAEHAEEVVERSQILNRVWGYDPGPESNTLGVYVGYLRRKLEQGGEPRLVHTVRSVGYVLRADA
jgi:two-component system, OmpR family, response regulator MprA